MPILWQRYGCKFKEGYKRRSWCNGLKSQPTEDGTVYVVLKHTAGFRLYTDNGRTLTLLTPEYSDQYASVDNCLESAEWREDHKRSVKRQSVAPIKLFQGSAS